MRIPIQQYPRGRNLRDTIERTALAVALFLGLSAFTMSIGWGVWQLIRLAGSL